VKLFVNGCSHSAGDGTSRLAHSWPNQLAMLLNADLINYSLSGASNQRMLRTTREWARNMTHEHQYFIIIGWSTWERQEWYCNQQFYQINASGHDGLPRDLHDAYKEYVGKLDDQSYVSAAKNTEQEIYQLAQQLQRPNVKYLFFNSFMQISETLKNHRWDHRYMTPFGNELNYFEYLKNVGYQHDENYHYGDDAQQAWAQVMFQYIKKHYDLQSH
jgi:hypothetical protein